MTIGILGGGAIGLSAAWYLTEAGASVTVIERGTCGAGSSSGNAGWITRSLSAPMPGPGLPGTALRYMASADSPLLIRPRLSWDFVRWCWRFWRSCNDEHYVRGLHSIMQLSERTMELLDGLQ